MPPALDDIVHVHLHQFEDKGQSARGLIVQHLVQLDYLGVRRQATQSLNLPQVVHLNSVRYSQSVNSDTTRLLDITLGLFAGINNPANAPRK